MLYIDYISNICYIQVKDKWLSSHRQAYGFSPRIYNSVKKQAHKPSPLSHSPENYTRHKKNQTASL